MKIDKIYVLNLEHRTDRKKEIIKELSKVDASNVEIFKAIKPQPDLVNYWNKDYLKEMPGWYTGNSDTYRIGALGCLLTHITIMKKALDFGYENILILEDDTEFVTNEKLDNIIKKYSKFLDNIDFGIFYLSGNNAKAGIKKIIDNIYLTFATYTTGSYIINKKTMKFIIDNINGYPKEIDKFYQEVIQNKFNCFVCHPPLTRQRSSFSDIVNKEVNYDLNKLK